MAEDFPRQVFQVKDLPTKSVTLYPARAHVVRELRDVVLQPGQNEIEIFGLTSDADENSVQIDGKGAATITDMTLELVPNPESFSDAYPSDSDSSDEDDSEYSDSDDEIASVKDLSKDLKELDLQIEAVAEKQKSAERRLKTLDAYSNGITGGTNGVKWSAKEVADALQLYDEQRKTLFELNSDAGVELKDLRKRKARVEAERVVVGKVEEKRKAKARKGREQQRDKTRRQREERRKEAGRIRDEKRKFWPHQVYKVTLGLETSLDTPSSSRRNSIDGVTLSGMPGADIKGKEVASSVLSTARAVTLSLSYVTNSAFWTPRYDLSISSQQKTATIVYRAEFSNGTSETWKDAKIILSTSQTSYSGLDDKTPFMHSWQVKLGRSWDNNAGHGGLLSSEELKGPRYQNAISQQASKANYKMKQAPQWSTNNYSQQQSFPPSGGLFANSAIVPSSNVGGGGLFGSAQSNMAPPPAPAMASAPLRRAGGAAAFGGFGSSTTSETASTKERKRSSRLGSNIFGSVKKQDVEEYRVALPEADDDGSVGTPVPVDEESGIDVDGLDFEESVWEDNGLTANYELPGIRTLIPSSLARRHKIASLNAVNINLSYICVPKLRSAAFLRAKIRNPSASVTLLKGTAGVTLDGSFLGNMTLPRVSPGTIFTLPLGVDPAIQISYPKPNVKRSTAGIFNKEANHVFNRSIWLTNTKSAPVEILVLDQVPVSQDERLRIDILQPRGLSREGDSVRAGQAAKEGGKEVAPTGKEGAWGKAAATLKKNGEVSWTVNLEKSAACLLKLEYEAKMPSGEGIVAV